MAAGGQQSIGSGDRTCSQQHQGPRQRRGARRARAQRAWTANGGEGSHGVCAAEGLGGGSALTTECLADAGFFQERKCRTRRLSIRRFGLSGTACGVISTSGVNLVFLC